MTESFTYLPGSKLPIYYKKRKDDILFYSTGYLMRVDQQYWDKSLEDTHYWKILQAHALVQEPLSGQFQEEFKPISLHIYLTRHCNLNCAYCFSSPRNANPLLISPSTKAIVSGAIMVAGNCQEAGLPMTLVCHGGGEPTQSIELFHIINSIRKICAEEGITLFSYLATNGVMRKAKANDICGKFDLVGLSCDGPPQIQDQQRPLENGRSSSGYVEQTASIFHRNNQPFETRVTLTANSWRKMPSIATYLINTIQPSAINVELVYRTTEPPLNKTEIDYFLEKYFTAQDYCKDANIPWRTSTVRPRQSHRQYCHIFQDTLQIVPGDIASLCFLDNDSNESKKRHTQIGAYNKTKNHWIIDQSYIYDAREKILMAWEECSQCFVSNHCHRTCPESCPFDTSQSLEEIRCQLNQRMLDLHLERAADQLINYCQMNYTKIAGMEILGC